MNDDRLLAREFESARPHLRAVAYRMLGSVAEADDAVQESWLRLSRADAGAVVDLRAWLTTVVGRICLDMLRARRARRVARNGQRRGRAAVRHAGRADLGAELHGVRRPDR